VNYQFEIRLALGEIEMKSGKTSAGVACLKSLERDAKRQRLPAYCPQGKSCG
jgi:hypothetical protein